MRDALHEVDGARDGARDDATPAQASPAANQGRYVVPFTLTREEEASAIEFSKQQLPQLLAECSRPPSSFSPTNADTAAHSDWERVPSSNKVAGLVLWEKGVASSKRLGRKGQEKPVVARRRASAPPVEATITTAATSSAVQPADEADVLTYSVRSSVRVRASLDTVLQTLDTSVATTHRSLSKIMYGHVVADASVLFHRSSARAHGAEALAVRWLVCRCSNPLASDADLCLQEYTRRHSVDELAGNSEHYSNNRDASPRESASHDGLHAAHELPAAYKLFHSTETRHCPELLESHRLLRCHVPLGGFLLYPTTHSEHTDVVFLLRLAQPRVQCSGRQFRALQLVARHLALRLGRLSNAVDALHLGQRLEALRAQRWVRNAERSECVVCFRRFHQLTRRRHHCRLCGEVICRDCSVHKDVELPSVGATVLRICSSCDGANSLRLEPNTPVASVTPRRRRGTLDVDDAKNVANESHGDGEAASGCAAARGGAQRRHASDQALSCPKPLVDRRYFATKWGNGRVLAAPASPTVATARSTPQPAIATPPALAMSRSQSETTRMAAQSSSKAAHTRPHPQSRAWGASSPRKHVPTSNNEPSEHEDKAEPPARAALLLSPATIAKVSGVRGHGAPSKVSNQQLELEQDALRGGLTAAPEVSELVPRSLGELDEYQDILLQLCQDAAAVRGSRFAALTLFAHEEGADQAHAQTVPGTHYLLAQGSAKLLEVAANWRCCEPVLQLRGPVGTRNAWRLARASSRHASGVDFRALPVVAGPQKARFYAGVLLLDAKRRGYYGALAVFDAALLDGEDDDADMQRTLRALQTCVDAAMSHVSERRRERELRSFLQMPLVRLRRSEPAIRLTTQLANARSYWEGGVVGKQESLDGDSDREDEEERERREAQDGEDAARDGGAGRDKNRVEYFRSRMQELVRQAEDTQAQVVENSLAMERHGVPIT